MNCHLGNQNSKLNQFHPLGVVPFTSYHYYIFEARTLTFEHDIILTVAFIGVIELHKSYHAS